MRCLRAVLTIVALVLSVGLARAQSTTTYHIHNETLPAIGKVISLAPPDAASVFVLSPELNGKTSGSITNFAFHSSVEFQQTTTVPAGSTVTYKIWMRKTTVNGRLAASASLGTTIDFNNRVEFCRGTATAELTTAQALYTFSCTTSAAISISPTRELSLIVSVKANANINKTVKAELAIEGAFQGQYDSRVDTPIPPAPPAISTVTPTAAPVNWAVTVAGTNFGAAAGTVKFGTTPGIPTNWTDTSIAVPVPAGASSGVVTVTTTAGTATGPTFTVIPPPAISAITPASAHRGEVVTITGTNFFSAQGSTVSFNGFPASPTNWTDTAITTAVPATATPGDVVVTVSNQQSNHVPFTVIIPGSVAGTVTRTTGGTGLAGATVQAVLTGTVKGTATTAANGTYSIPTLDPAAYDVRVTATGFSSELRQNVVVTPSTATTVNVSMSTPGAIAGKVTQADGTTPIAGAAVTVHAGAFQKGSASTNATGDYVISALHPGAYTVQAVNVGNRTREQGAVVTENTTTTTNLSLDPAPAGPVLYAYDAIGRLIQVTDPSGDAAIYHYDAVGNVTSIERTGANAVSVSGFRPASGAVGTSVTIYGTAFSTTSLNTVTFGAAQVTALATTPNQITVAVPVGASNGVISVSNTIGSDSSADSFTVTPASAGAPTITGFSPSIAAVGTSVTIAGTNFDPVAANNRTTANLTFMSLSSAAAETLTAPVPWAGSGPIAVTTPRGSAVSTTDLFIAPPPYTVAQVGFTARTTIGGIQTVNIDTANRIGLVTFAAQAGQRIAVRGTQGLSGFTIGCDLNVSILSPYGAALAPPTCMEQSGFIDVQQLAAKGTYTLLVVPTNPAWGSVTLALVDVLPDPVATIAADGQPVTIETSRAGQNAKLTFQGTAGQKISLLGTQGMSGQVSLTCDVNVTILGPDMSPVTGATACMEDSGFIDPASMPAAGLPAAGTYTILVDPAQYATGSLTLRLYTVTDFAGTIAPDGSPVTVPLAPPGRNATLTFSGTALQWVSLVATGISGQIALTCDVNVSILKPNNAGTLVSPTCVEGNGFIDAVQLPTTGTYTIVVDPTSYVSGDLTMTLYTATPASGSVAINGGAASFTISPGQNIDVTFAGAASQTVRGSMTTGVGVCATLKILRADGTTVVSTYSSCGTTITMPATTLPPAAETYHFIVDVSGAAAGTFSVSVISP
ncbi:MAG TPA: carboxypeptidase regulatory-like domain-containing protein [Vicinamibacterales bacterium]|nr:carboxypeptidase regulatory-like domain-containing protein [Vicinamibacterales bacterium]